MLSPEYLARIAEGSEEIASQLHTYIIRQIIDRMMIRIGLSCLLYTSFCAHALARNREAASPFFTAAA